LTFLTLRLRAAAKRIDRATSAESSFFLAATFQILKTCRVCSADWIVSDN
jgi:hypothetical protein